jgi:hypothetical protein
VNIFTKDLEALFRSKPNDGAIKNLENDFSTNKSIRAASLLSWYYLLGNYEDATNTRDWKKSLSYLKEILKLEKKDSSLTRGSSHNSFLVFLLQQSVLIKNFTYFDNDFIS